MPELPEVETMRRECERKLVGRMLGRITVAPGSARQLVGECREWSSLRGQRVRALERHGKWLLMRLHSGVTVAIHPRMSGRLLVCNPTELARLAPHARVVMRLDNGRLAVLNDARRFGRVLQLPVGTNQPQRTGPDAMKISRASFAAALTSTSRSVKAALLDQVLLAGVGNIYADEMLWMAQVHPGGRADALTHAQSGELHKAMGRVLRGAIVRSGTSFDAGYEGGRNQHQRTGPDAIKISRASFAAALTSTSRSVKAALLDQVLLAGVGNIYADEMLW
ncbi:MAG: hypothetical protein EXS01_00630, partial [Phycisphaerales bacterium]|nr:hypothetical protein [Phycisphaerales bacterium]